ncbi:DUF2867 domain-containing protein [Streptomyces mauvecolor]|uniref:DUF2867 domain-containing protein n=1 Tax=Streptomyces mauvecolor TaxID=58345 RepID=A0ABV9UIQ1_9ACTN
MPTEPEAWTDVLRGAPFPVVGRTGLELLLGREDRHLGFRASTLVACGPVTFGTVVRLHNPAGRLYFAVVRRVRPFMARLMLRRTHRRPALAVPTAADRATSVTTELPPWHGATPRRRRTGTAPRLCGRQTSDAAHRGCPPEPPTV